MQVFEFLTELFNKFRAKVLITKNKLFFRYQLYARAEHIAAIRQRVAFVDLINTIVRNDIVGGKEVLLNNNLNLNIRDYRNGITPLHVAAYYNRVEFINLLLNKNANIDQTTYAGNTALHFAINGSRNRVDTINTLLNANADPNIINQDGYSALDLMANKPRSKPIPFKTKLPKPSF